MGICGKTAYQQSVSASNITMEQQRRGHAGRRARLQYSRPSNAGLSLLDMTLTVLGDGQATPCGNTGGQDVYDAAVCKFGGRIVSCTPGGNCIQELSDRRRRWRRRHGVSSPAWAFRRRPAAGRG